MEDKEGGSDSVFGLLFFRPFILATAFHSPAQRAHAATECAARLSIRRSSRVIYRDYTGGAVRVLQKPCARVILENLRVANVTT